MPIHLGQLGIAEEVVRKFQLFIRLHSKGKVVLREGEETDPRIFLLRVGTVEVAKQVGDRQQVLTQIEAVNFFGEIAVVAARPRMATITAVSEVVLVYAFDNANLPAMLVEPQLGSLLIRWMAESIDHMNLRYEQIQLQIERLTKQGEQLQQHDEQLTVKLEKAQLRSERLRTLNSNILGLFQKLHQTVGHDPVLRRQFLEAVPKLVDLHAKELKVVPAPPDNSTLADYWQHGALPKRLFLAATQRADP